MLRFCKNIYKEAYSYTSIDCYKKTIVLEDKKIELELWDTAGQERFRAIIKEYFRKADSAILAYDMTNLETFMKLSNWLNELREIKNEATIVLVGNKADLQHRNQVSRSTVEKYTLEEGLDFYEASAKNNENIDEVFKNLAMKVLERKRISPFFKEIVNIENKSINSNNTTSDSNQKQTENSLPPVIRLEDEVGVDNDRIHLAIEKPKLKQNKCCW
ncbi:unnamed protein product [Larinioides sclopetarius]